MTGRQAEVTVRGARNELAAAHLIGGLASTVKVPREHDFGIDYFCELYATNKAHTVDSDQMFALQVKGGAGALTYGGVRDGEWRSYELTWLRSVMLPLFLGRVHHNPSRLELYAMSPVWRVFWLSDNPFQITCETGSDSSSITARPEATFVDVSVDCGDRRHWTVHLGPPLLRMSDAEATDPSFVANARYVLKRQIDIERRNLLNFFQRVAIHECLYGWTTNDFIGQAQYHRAMYWDVTPGRNLQALSDVVAPALVNLCVHLQWQDNHDVYRFMDALKWLQGRNALDVFGMGLLRLLTETQAAGLSPKPPAPTSSDILT